MGWKGVVWTVCRGSEVVEVVGERDSAPEREDGIGLWECDGIMARDELGL